MNKVSEIIKTRRSVKSFKPDPVDEKDWISWLEAASFAPNHRMTEPWEIQVIGPETRAKLNHKKDFGGAPLVISVLSKPARTPFERDENLIATACFVQNFLLAAHEAGVGVYWSSMCSSASNREILGVPEDYDVVGVFGIGYPETIPAVKERTPIQSKIAYLS